MKTKLLTLVLCCLTGALPAVAGERGPLAIITDAVVVRPVSLAVTALGAGLFVVALPFSVPSKSTAATAEALVNYPARMTFERPLGDLDSLSHPALAETGTTDDAVDESKFSELPEENPAAEP